MTISVLQAAMSDTSGSGPTCTQNITVSAGNTIQVFISYSGAGTSVATVADGTNTYTLIAALRPGGLNLEHWYASNVSAGTFTVTATYDVDVNYRAMCLKEIGGTSGLDTNAEQVQAVSTTNVDDITTGNSAALSADASLISGVAHNTNGTVACVAGTGFTSDCGGMQLGTGINLGRGESKRVTGSSAVAATFTQASDGVSYNNMMAVFKETAPQKTYQIFPPWSKAGIGTNRARVGSQFAFMGATQDTSPKTAFQWDSYQDNSFQIYGGRSGRVGLIGIGSGDAAGGGIGLSAAGSAGD